MATASVSAALSRSTTQHSCSKWLRQALETATRALRKQKERWTEPAEDKLKENLAREAVVYWNRGCEFAGQRIDSQSFIYASQHSFCVLTPRPVVSGHAIVCPRRPAKALFELTTEEVDDLFLTTQVLSWLLTAYCGSTATTVRLQQGEGARQTLSHLFVHVVPRRANDLPCNDDIYTLLDDADPLFDSSTGATDVLDPQGNLGQGGAERLSDYRLPLEEHDSSVPQRVQTMHSQCSSPVVDERGSKRLTRAEVERQTQEIRTWLLNLVFDEKPFSHA